MKVVGLNKSYRLFGDNGKDIGSFHLDSDGFYYFWQDEDLVGCWSANDLREIAIIHFIENGLTTTEIANILGFRKTTEVDKIYKEISKYYLKNHPERVQNLT